MMDVRAFWLVVMVIAVQLLLICAVVFQCLMYADKYVATGNQCLPSDVRNSFNATLAGLLAAAIAIYMGKKT